jgi:hypothetical protein
MLKQKKTLLSLLAAPILAGAAYFAFRDARTPQIEDARVSPKPATTAYVERRELQKQKDFETWLYSAKKPIKNDNIGDWLSSLDYSIESCIENNGYVHVRSNVSALEETELICLGEVHEICGNEESSIFANKFVGKNDKILVEASPPYEIDFSEQEQEGNKLKEKAESLNRSSQEQMKRTIDYLDFILGKLETMDLKDGSERSVFSVLSLYNKGRVIGADSSKEIKEDHVCSIIEQSYLPIVEKQTRRNEAMHPFYQWMIFDCLKIARRNEEPSKIAESIRSYIQSIPSEEEHMRRRDEGIVNRIVNEVKTNPRGRRAWMIFGSRHVNNKLFERLENEGIQYAAFHPDIHEVIKDSEIPGTNSSEPEHKLNQHSANYSGGEIIPCTFKSEKNAAHQSIQQV